MEIKIPKTFVGKPVEGAMERALQKQQEKTEQERSLDSLQELIDRITNLETMIKSGKCGLVSIPIKAIILICLVIGVLCILSTILKSWLSQPNHLDWDILFVGLVLCAISLFKKFSVGKQGVTASLKGFESILRNTRDVIGSLIMKK